MTNSKADRYKPLLLVREGFMTTRQGYPGIEMGYPEVVREDLPEYRSRDGTQIGPLFYNPAMPWHHHQGTKGAYYPRFQASLSQAQGPGHHYYTPTTAMSKFNEDPSFKNGYYYPYKRNHNIHYEHLPQTSWNIPLQNPLTFAHKSDELRKWLFGLR